MNTRLFQKSIRQVLPIAIAVVMMAGPSFAVDFYLVAKEFKKTMSDGTTIPMWGFAEDADKNLSTHGSEIPTVPGPMITVNPAPLTVLEAHFNKGADGFAYLDDPFRGTARPKYSRGVWLPFGGFSGGALRVALGGRNYSDILGMSGGGRQPFP